MGKFTGNKNKAVTESVSLGICVQEGKFWNPEKESRWAALEPEASQAQFNLQVQREETVGPI